MISTRLLSFSLLWLQNTFERERLSTSGMDRFRFLTGLSENQQGCKVSFACGSYGSGPCNSRLGLVAREVKAASPVTDPKLCIESTGAFLVAVVL